LLKTKEIAENKLGFNVVYGDTDSIMINTGT
jgi:DNA polymerase elongation subunit (family B)